MVKVNSNIWYENEPRVCCQSTIKVFDVPTLISEKIEVRVCKI